MRVDNGWTSLSECILSEYSLHLRHGSDRTFASSPRALSRKRVAHHGIPSIPHGSRMPSDIFAPKENVRVPRVHLARREEENSAAKGKAPSDADGEPAKSFPTILLRPQMSGILSYPTSIRLDVASNCLGSRNLGACGPSSGSRS
jgi:hypothetical protein